eukprot:4599812-Amphidinium_carterae.1
MTRRRAQQASEKAAVYTPKKVPKPPPAPAGSNGWEWWKETQQVRAQPAAAASTAKWEWWDETQKEQASSEASWSMVPTPQQDNDE